MLSKKQILSLFATLCGILLFISYNKPSPLIAQTVTHKEVIAKENYVVTLPQTTSSVPQGKYEYVEITESCGPYTPQRVCIYAHASPSANSEEIFELHSGMVFKITSKVEKNGQTWYRVHFDEWLRYPERVAGDWYIPAVAGRIVTSDGDQVLGSVKPTTAKIITVDLSEHMIYAYDGDKQFLVTKVSTGALLSPTPTGTFTIYKKTPSRYMQGPLPGVTDTPFDLPGVPWNLYFTQDGAVIHGTYWHDRYGTGQSSGCINLPPELAKLLYDWADLGTKVVVHY